MTQTKNIVLVHGGFVDGSGWEGVYSLLKKDGYNVAIVQNPTISLADDVAVTKRVINEQDGPVILVGHSYGGAVITEAGTDPKVVGLVYITAFAPDKGESVNSLIKNPPPDAPVPPILPPTDGYLFLDKTKFAASFAGDVDSEKAAFMADSQVPWGVQALAGEISEPAWKSKRILVKGGTRGIGEAIVDRLIRGGGDVIATARSVSPETSTDRFVQADVSTREGIESVVKGVTD